MWKYAGARTSKKSFGKKHDVIFFYTKNAGNQILNFDEVRDPYSETTIARNKYKNQGSSDRVLNYKPNEKGKYPEDVWDISIINPMSKERTGYPTQKPEALLEKVIKAASNKGDLVLDCFGGSGTTSAVAEKLGRRWITVDAGKLAIYTMQKRILDIDNYSPFVVYDAGLYDNEKLNAFDSTQWKQFAMALYNVQPYYQLIKGLPFDGMKDGSPVKVYSQSELNEMDAKISEVTLEQIYSRLGSSSPSEIFIIAPKGKFTFAVDEFDNDGEWDTIFNILRVPYSMYQKYTENFKGTIQAGDTDAVNKVVDAYGFDFMRKPNVDFEITCGKLKINSFESYSRLKGVENVTGFEAFALLLIDLSYDNNAFKVDKVYYHKDFDENHSILLDETEIDGQAMFIFVDKFGNEFVTTRGEKS